jgi:lysophospholipase L1-like esterase
VGFSSAFRRGHYDQCEPFMLMTMDRHLFFPAALLLCAYALAGCRHNARNNTAAGSAPATAAAATAPAQAAGDIPFWARDRNGALTPPHDEHATPSAPAPPGLYVAMGDSITYGVGVTENCHAFPAHPVDIAEYCPDGTSYAILVAKAVRDAGLAGHFMNIGISGAHVERVISDELPWLPPAATLVTLYIGTNDSRAVRDPKVSIAEAVSKFETHFDQLLDQIHARAPQALIVLINFPNEKYLAATYNVPNDVLPRYDATSQILDAFIDAHYPKYAVVDTICNPASYDNSLLFKGGVHPNEAGAAILANLVAKILLSRKPPPPPNSCQWFDVRTAADLGKMQ